MNREEAIAELNVLHERLSNPKDCEDGCYSWEDGWYVEAIDMAIEALSAERTGEWIDKGEYAECSMCGAHSGTQFDGVEPIPLKTNYCPNCGARMKGGDDE